MKAIEVKNFKKNYGSTEAVKGIDFSVEKGELFGIIGPDGAGKTTLIRAICTLLVPDEGSIFLEGLDVIKTVSQIRSILGYMPQRFSLYQDLSVEQNLRFFAELFQVEISEREERLNREYFKSQEIKMNKLSLKLIAVTFWFIPILSKVGFYYKPRRTKRRGLERPQSPLGAWHLRYPAEPSRYPDSA